MNDPSGGICFNISQATTFRELIDIEGVGEQTRRMQGINYCGGYTNAVEFCTGIFKMPTLDMMLDQFILDERLTIENISLEDTQHMNALVASDDDLAATITSVEDEDEEAMA